MKLPLLVALVAAVAARADTDAAPEAPSVETDAPPPAAPVDVGLLEILNLPVIAQALRDDDVPDEDVAEMLRTARDHGLDAVATTDMMRRAARSAREHGPVGELGAFVKEQLDAGKRGRDLADAIRDRHAEKGRLHVIERERARKFGTDGRPPEGAEGADDADDAEDDADRGKGPPADAGRPDAPRGGEGRPPEAGEKGRGGGRPDDAGRAGAGGGEHGKEGR